MKKFFLFLVVSTMVLAMTLVGCRKEEPRVLGDGSLLTTYPLHCYNGINDENEVAIDCGGSCPACDVVNVPCTSTENVVKIGATSFNMTTTCSLINGAKVIRGTSGSTYIEIRFPTATVIPGIFVFEEGPILDDKPTINLFRNFYDHYHYSTLDQNCYVISNTDGLNVAFCGLSVTGTEGFTEVTYIIEGELKCN